MALSDNLISYWSLDEASGNALDAHGSNDLTETSGTIDSAAGKVGNCRDFENADSEYFEHTDNADLSVGDIDFSFAFWFNRESAAGTAVLGKYDFATNNREYLFDLSSGITFTVSSNGLGGANQTNVSTGGSFSNGTWYFIAGGHNASTNEIWISRDAGTPVTTSWSAGVFNGAAPFRLGSINGLGDYDGKLDEVGFWKRDIRADLAALYNSGNGLSYDDIVGGGGEEFNPLLLFASDMRGGMAAMTGGLL